jgi:hypothetical protein
VDIAALKLVFQSLPPKQLPRKTMMIRFDRLK